MNVKPGDLAILIACPSFPENLGAIVSVLGRWSDEEWVCKVEGTPLMVYLGKHGGMGHSCSSKGHVAIPDAWLKPVSGLTRTEDEKLDEILSQWDRLKEKA
jgi:hypothetical protein